jgi:hypothetical protein
MNKTLHRKLTAKTALKNALPSFGLGAGNIGNDLLLEAARDLLQPRPQAVASLLKLAKDI